MAFGGFPELEIKHRFMVVEGPIGVGKTSLVKRLATHLRAEMLLEGAEENPYDRSPLLIINAAEINPVESDEDFRFLLEHISVENPGRRYLNPAPLLF